MVGIIRSKQLTHSRIGKYDLVTIYIYIYIKQIIIMLYIYFKTNIY